MLLTCWSADFMFLLILMLLCWCLKVFEEELWKNSRFILSIEVSSGKRSTLDVLPKPPKWGNSRIETSSNHINIWGLISNQGSRGHSGLSSKRCITNLRGNSKHEKPFRWLLYAVSGLNRVKVKTVTSPRYLILRSRSCDLFSEIEFEGYPTVFFENSLVSPKLTFYVF